MSALSRNELISFIHARIWEGHLGFEAIRDSVLPLSSEPDTWVEMEIGRQLAEKRKVERSWPTETDCDRLCKAFLELQALHIITMHAPDLRLTGCLGAARDAWINDGAEQSPKIGYLTYSCDCIQVAMKYSELYLSFGIIPVSPLVSKGKISADDIATISLDVIRATGLTARRREPFCHIISVEPFTWQKRTPGVRN